MNKICFFLSCISCNILFTIININAQTPTIGLISHLSGSLDDGYVLFAPIRSDTTYLIDKCGREIHKWASGNAPGLSVYLLSDGSILRTEALMSSVFNLNGAAGGKIQRINWDGSVSWSYTLHTATETQNHDIYPLPNGNILVSVWVVISDSQAIAAGRNPALLGSSLWSAEIMELQPVGTSSANIVWQWNLWDHLIQDFDSTKSNYGVVADHPELLNLNFTASTSPDWIHQNAVIYNPGLDQVMISAHNLSEIYIVDHSTTTSVAASHSGGIHGKGGDFLYRWGNPQAYNRGSATDQKLFLQHNPTWIPQGYKDAGKIMIFNNGNGRPGGNASSVDIINPPVDSLGNYTILTGQPFGPSALDWTYMNVVPADFYAKSMGSAQRLSNGNTLVDAATTGDFFEIDSVKNTVWEYINPVDSTGPISQGTTSASTQVFRCVFYPDTSSAFTGVVLTPGNPIEQNPYPYTCSLNSISGISEIKMNQEITVFPNPTSGYFNIELDNGEVTKSVEVTNLLGQTVCLATSQEINLSQEPVGLYFIKVTTRNGNFMTVKLIKN